MSESFEFPEADWATVGTVGPPGQRTFYFQVRQGARLVTLKLEKQQVAALAQLLTEILSDLPAPEDIPGSDALALVEPAVAEWVVGGMQLAYDAGADRIIIVAEEVGDAVEADEEEEEEEEEDGEGAEEGIEPEDAEGEGDQAIGRLALTRGQAFALARRGEELVSAGRPTCPLCGLPMDPAGHACPRTNGHRPTR